jgi:hypothetical protein
MVPTQCGPIGRPLSRPSSFSMSGNPVELSASRRRVPAAFWFVTTVAKPASPWLALQKNGERIGLFPTASRPRSIQTD